MKAAIQIKKINKSFKDGKKRQLVLRDLSLDIFTGEAFGFLGPNGAGKSTTIKLLLRFIRPDSGTMRIQGKTVGKEEFRNHIGYLSEFPCFYEHLTAEETLLLSGRLSGMKPKDLEKRIPALLTRLNLSESSSRRVGGFSKGMKQRLGMANALIHDPQVLIFDEPMSGLDPLGRHLMKNMILELKEAGKTIFFSSHILRDIETLCDRIGVIHKGRLLYNGDLTDFLPPGTDLEERFIAIIKEADHADYS